jgi:hypothetical protein
MNFFDFLSKPEFWIFQFIAFIIISSIREAISESKKEDQINDLKKEIDSLKNGNIKITNPPPPKKRRHGGYL